MDALGFSWVTVGETQMLGKDGEMIGPNLSDHWVEVDFTQHFPKFLCFTRELPTTSQSYLKSSTSSLSLVHLQSIHVGRRLSLSSNLREVSQSEVKYTLRSNTLTKILRE